MRKISNDLQPPFRQEIFCEDERHYNLRNNSEFNQPRVRAVSNGTESVRIKGPQLWKILPEKIQNSKFLKDTKDQKGERCPCMLCRITISNLGFYNKSLWTSVFILYTFNDLSIFFSTLLLTFVWPTKRN